MSGRADHALTLDQGGLVELLRQALTADRGRVQTIDTARRRHDTLRAAQDLLAGRGEQLGARVVQLLVEEARAVVAEFERQAAEHAAEQARRDAAALAVVAADLDGHVLVADGGASTLGAAEWIAGIEAWARERR
jgi:hypothetical protein